MKIDFSTKINTIHGTPFQVPNGEGGTRDMELKDVCVEALYTPNPQSPDSGAEKFRLHQLAVKLHRGGEIEISPEDVALVKDKIGTLYGANVVGPAYEILNG